ncbi:hypothetical protein OsI_34905 [Oryza sativa Indica Group]|uniref:Uncharacterized protein n=1 Tax=Oryza sativa subsp. indica TaxID=39946 RepID=B8BIS8_ORYSI|nr:hypothetical protein OsI_34905 [Oryza sativa Indica Group]
MGIRREGTTRLGHVLHSARNLLHVDSLRESSSRLCLGPRGSARARDHAPRKHKSSLITEKLYWQLETRTKKLRFTLPFTLLAFPVYLWYRSPGKTGSHFLPSSDLFSPKEKSDVIVSTTCWCIMISLLVALACVFGPVPVLMLYGVPYLVFVMWLDLVTYLHHHGHNDLPWYRGEVKLSVKRKG